jgi:hypothetical protein
MCLYAGQFAEYCQPDILHFNQSVLPVIFQTLEDPRPTLQGTSCYVLEYFWSASSIHWPRYIHIDNRSSYLSVYVYACVYVSENLQPETLRPYLPMLLTRLATLLQSPQKTTKVSTTTSTATTSTTTSTTTTNY